MANTPKKKIYEEKVDGAKFAKFLVTKKTVKLMGVGTFQLTIKKPYMGYSPAKGQREIIDGGVRVGFRPERGLKLAIKEHVKAKKSAKVG